ncbi:probable WRKY transcription factor 46 [Salvia miltiorrhiza]|uniref:probable WRKY transcription factor 46 n=1 Tax=Salvia miltiorrhiza TaxID=226208 RepID=UPI0025AD4043|nr:probable WRKY transcription factor 46 [Salvia miltiorrhiza]
MENAESWGRDIDGVISQLNHGMKLSNRLKKQLHHHSNPSDCGFLIEKIVSCYDNALRLLSYMDSLQKGEDSTNLLHFGPTTEGYVPKKRKSLERWSEEVHVCCETSSEDQHEDGYNWRKYGQKDILGATHPRAYYRCTYRNTRSCLATKQVQRGEDDPSILKIVYKGKHSCGVNRSKENVVVTAETNVGESNQLMKHESPPLILLEPTSMSTCHLSNFLDPETTSFPLGDLDFLIDFDASFLEASSHDYLSHVQQSKI